MKTRRYSVPCRHCDGSGLHPLWVDDDGQGHLDKCDCYRGRVTILLTPDDERALLRELQANVATPTTETTGIPAVRG